VYTKYLLATPPKVVHDPSAVAIQVENHCANCGRDKQGRHFHTITSQ